MFVPLESVLHRDVGVLTTLGGMAGIRLGHLLARA